MRLLFLHALPLDGRMWAAQMHLLPGATSAPTLYGAGSSLEEWAEYVLAEVGHEELVVVGCSVGGSCALEVAARAPDQVAALVLIGAKAGHRPEPGLRDAAVRLLRSEGLAVAWSRYWEPLFGPNVDPQVVAAAHAIALDQDVADVVRGVEAFHSRRDLTHVAETWSRPLVVIAGEHDRTPSTATMAALVESAPRGAFHVVPEAGHYVNLEQPDVVQSIIGDVLESV